MTSGGFNLWLESLSGTDEESPEDGIARIFRVTPERARVLLDRLPCTVKRNVTRDEAIRVGEALISIGGLVRLDKAFGDAAHAKPKPSKPASAARIAPSPSVRPRTPATPSKPANAASAAPAPVVPPSAFAIPRTHANDPSTAATQAATPSFDPPPVVPPAQQSTASTVKLGTLDTASGHDALRPSQLEVERTANAQPFTPYAANPASEFGSLDIEPTALPRPSAPAAPHFATMTAQQAFEIEHTRHEPQVGSSPLTSNAPQPSDDARPKFEPLDFGPASTPPTGSAPQPAMEVHELGVEHPLQRQANRALALPASDAPPAPSSLRPPSERRPDPKPRAPAPARAAASARPGAALVNAAADIAQTAQSTSWRTALQGHPVVGFVLVLGATTSAALLLYFIA
jgi:hypothetical protein